MDRGSGEGGSLGRKELGLDTTERIELNETELPLTENFFKISKLPFCTVRARTINSVFKFIVGLKHKMCEGAL